jgi:hypothetical protein
MAFMMKKKRYKFQADLCLDELTEVTYSKAILFAKVRQLDGGSFTDVSRRYVETSMVSPIPSLNITKQNTLKMKLL